MIAESSSFTAQLMKLYARLNERLSEINEVLSELERTGLTEAKPTYFKKKYLYMTYPARASSKRKRTYVGIDPKKQQQALAPFYRMQRYKLWAEKKTIIIKVLGQIDRSSQHLVQDIVNTLNTSKVFDDVKLENTSN